MLDEGREWSRLESLGSQKKKKLILNRNRWKERLVYSDSQRRRNSQKIELERRADWNRSNPRCKADLEGETAMKERRNIATKGESELKEKEKEQNLKERNGSELFLNRLARYKFAQLPIPRTLRDPKLPHPLTPFSSRESKAQSCLQKKRQNSMFLLCEVSLHLAFSFPTLS